MNRFCVFTGDWDFGHIGVVSPYLRYAPDLSLRTVNTRRMFGWVDLERVRAMYPGAVGIRVFVVGNVVMLFRRDEEVWRSWERDGYPGEVGGFEE